MMNQLWICGRCSSPIPFGANHSCSKDGVVIEREDNRMLTKYYLYKIDFTEACMCTEEEIKEYILDDGYCGFPEPQRGALRLERFERYRKELTDDLAYVKYLDVKG